MRALIGYHVRHEEHLLGRFGGAFDRLRRPAVAPAREVESAATVVPLPTGVLAPGAEVESAAVIVFSEGPAAHADGSVYFSEINGNRILRLMPDGTFSEFRDPAGRSNGLAFDPQGRLVAAEGANTGGGRRVSRTDLATGKVETLVDSIDGKKLNSPNDLVIALDGRIYFSDPRYVGDEPRELDSEDVYLIRPDGTTVSVATAPDILKPNGVALSPDQKTLYVADTQPGPPREARVVAFDVQEDGTLANPRTHYSFGSGTRHRRHGDRRGRQHLRRGRLEQGCAGKPRWGLCDLAGGRADRPYPDPRRPHHQLHLWRA